MAVSSTGAMKEPTHGASDTPRPLLELLKTLHPFVAESIHDRVHGTIIGSALGDAIGVYTEFLDRRSARRNYPSRKFSLVHPVTKNTGPNGNGYTKEGRWTDDTDQAICIILSFLHLNGTLDALDFAARLKLWVYQGLRALNTLPLGLGAHTRLVTRDPSYSSDPVGTAHKYWRNMAPKMTKGPPYFTAANGSLMRTGPIGVLCLNKTLSETFHIAADFCLISHSDPRCVISSVIGDGLIRGLALGGITEEHDIDELIQVAIEWYDSWQDMGRNALPEGDYQRQDPKLDKDELSKHTQANSMQDLQLDEEEKIGYVLKCLGSGLVCLRLAMRKVKQTGGKLADRLQIVEKLITDLTTEGGDADTNGAFAGAVLGAYLGYKSFPPHWTMGLRNGKWLTEKSEAVSQLVGIVNGQYDGKKDPDTYPDGGRGFLSKEEAGERMRLFVRGHLQEG